MLRLLVTGLVEQNPGQNTSQQYASQNCKGGQNAGQFLGQGGQNAGLVISLKIISEVFKGMSKVRICVRLVYGTYHLSNTFKLEVWNVPKISQKYFISSDIWRLIYHLRDDTALVITHLLQATHGQHLQKKQRQCTKDLPTKTI